jgi:Protein of unknown function (DUF1572)
MHITDFVDEYRRWRLAAEKAIAQVPDDELNRILSKDGNSIAMLMRHVGGNLVSRFTDFLTSDGEKPWRDRDSEFSEGPFSRADAEALWTKGWAAVDSALAPLTDDDLGNSVVLRGKSLTIHAALTRSISHVANHCGQIILLARILTSDWQWITIPKGKSREYNENPTLERSPSR